MKNLIESVKHGKSGASVYFATKDWKIREGLITAYEELRKDYNVDFVDHNIFCGLKIFVEGQGVERTLIIREVKEKVKNIINEKLKEF